ncbi:MAG: hypothetical protein H7246_20875 [Phycisphaerae bacterium]|nr:hypothetical protein [Saprospiraceae bacterium]
MHHLEFPNNKISRLQRQKRRDKRLSEELIECRRYNGGDSNKKKRQKGERRYLQNMERNGIYPSHESIDFNYSTYFGDNLEPLERFLRSNVGRPWSEVYSELSRQLDRSTVSGEHVFQHLQDYMGNSRWENQIPLESQQYRKQNDGISTRFGVHPETDLLCIVNPKNPLPKGPFPKQARFKKAKQRLKLKMRLGLEQKSRPQKPLPNLKEWFQQFVLQQVSASNGYKWDEFLHKNADFWEGDVHIILNLHRMEWTTYQKRLYGAKFQEVPANKLKGRLWLKSSSIEKPKQIVFESLWDTSYLKMLDWVEG